MSFAVNLPLFCIVASLLCGVLSSVLPQRAGKWLTCLLSAATAAASGLVLIFVLQRGAPVIYQMGHFPHPWGNELSFGILEPLICMLFSLVLLLCMVGGARELERDTEPEKRGLYFSMADLVLASLLALSYTNDVFTGYVFIEICTIAACGLLMIRQIGRTTLASVRYMIFSLIGSGLFLLGVTFLYSVTGHLLMPELRQAVADLWQTGAHRTALLTAIVLMTVGLCVKSGLFPFHFWMPDTYGAATPASSGILSGLVSKGYILLLIKLIFRVFGAEVFYACGVRNVLYVLGVAGMVVGSVSAMRQNDIARMIALSSAAQIGYIYMGLGISPGLGVTAALFHILTHALTKPALFLSAAKLRQVSGNSRRFKDLQGSAHKNPIAGAAFAIGAFSMIGLPMTMGFIAKYLFALAGFHTVYRLVPTMLALAVSTVLNTYYFARTVIRIYNTRDLGAYTRVRLKDQPGYAAAALVLAGLNVLFGVLSAPLIHLLERGVAMLGV